MAKIRKFYGPLSTKGGKVSDKMKIGVGRYKTLKKGKYKMGK